MISRQFAVLILSLSIFDFVGAGEDEVAEKKAHAVSKEVYDEIQRTYDVFEYLSSIGISAEDIEPSNLQFTSTSYDDCRVKAFESLTTEEEIAIAEASCLMRHPPEWAQPKDGE